MYTFHGLEHRHSLHTTRRLNTGEWQQVLIDVHLRQLRFLVNSEQRLITVEHDANLGVLDGSMFLGGMPELVYSVFRLFMCITVTVSVTTSLVSLLLSLTFYHHTYHHQKS